MGVGVARARGLSDAFRRRAGRRHDGVLAGPSCRGFVHNALTGPRAAGAPRGARGDLTLVRTLSQASLIFENSGGPAVMRVRASRLVPQFGGLVLNGRRTFAAQRIPPPPLDRCFFFSTLNRTHGPCRRTCGVAQLPRSSCTAS